MTKKYANSLRQASLTNLNKYMYCKHIFRCEVSGNRPSIPPTDKFCKVWFTILATIHQLHKCAKKIFQQKKLSVCSLSPDIQFKRNSADVLPPPPFQVCKKIVGHSYPLPQHHWSKRLGIPHQLYNCKWCHRREKLARNRQ